MALIDGDDWLDETSRPNVRVRAGYQDLVTAKQIEFVTFHQSHAYEDFVEGLGPKLGSADDGDEEAIEVQGRSPSAGFELRPVAGVFNRISARAEHARLTAQNPSATSGASFELGKRRVYKMSIGRAGQEDFLFDAAIEDGYAALGWGRDEDWSDPKI